jgi:hypothetical protein
MNSSANVASIAVCHRIVRRFASEFTLGRIVDDTAPGVASANLHRSPSGAAPEPDDACFPSTMSAVAGPAAQD